jgi:hypothetical protein
MVAAVSRTRAEGGHRAEVERQIAGTTFLQRPGDSPAQALGRPGLDRCGSTSSTSRTHRTPGGREGDGHLADRRLVAGVAGDQSDSELDRGAGRGGIRSAARKRLRSERSFLILHQSAEALQPPVDVALDGSHRPARSPGRSRRSPDRPRGEAPPPGAGRRAEPPAGGPRPGSRAARCLRLRWRSSSSTGVGRRARSRAWLRPRLRAMVQIHPRSRSCLIRSGSYPRGRGRPG